jgi:acetyl-CoA carboxylase biotin carboxyl carrier protein
VSEPESEATARPSDMADPVGAAMPAAAAVGAVPRDGPSGTDPLGFGPSSTDALDGADASLLGLVDRLAAVLERSDLLELEVQAGGTALILRRPEALAPGGGAPAATGSRGGMAEGGHGTAHPDRGAGPEGEAPEAERASVAAPLTGIWYSAPSPGSAPFVRVGGEVAVGQVIGLIEAMKLFNEIKSDLAGRVVRVAVENGQLVKAKQPLIEVEPL